MASLLSYGHMSYCANYNTKTYPNVNGLPADISPPPFLGGFLALRFLIRLLILRSRILWHAIPIYLIPSHRVGLSSAQVAAVAFYGVDVSAVAAFYDAHVVSAAVTVPVKEDNVPGSRFVLSATPLVFLLEPVYPVGYQCEFWNDSSLYITALIGAP